MAALDLAQVMEQDHRALDAFAKGDPEPLKKLRDRRMKQRWRGGTA